MAHSKHSFSPILPWADRFNVPSIERLSSGLPHACAPLFRNARKMLHELGLTDECVAWHGECWKWTVEFRPFHGRELAAVLVPSPENLQMAIPVSREFLQSLPIKRLKKAVREGLELASEPFDTHLAVWSLVSSPLVSDLHDLLHRRVRHLARKTG